MSEIKINTEMLSGESAINYTHCYVQCVDNMQLLKSQPNESVDLIYSDILYGTDRNFGEYQDLKPKRNVIESHYLPRLIEMKRVLKQNGSIYLQMDTRINHWMRILMDKVFGYDNFRNEIVWRIGWISGFKTHSKTFVRNHDIILRYSKSDVFSFNKFYIQGKGGRKGIVNRPIEDCWNCSDYDKLDSNNLKSFSKEKGYPTQKPKALIERFVLASSNENDVVADYYLGSGTTAEVCKQLNRNFIGCDTSEKAIEITKQRLSD